MTSNEQHKEEEEKEGSREEENSQSEEKLWSQGPHILVKSFKEEGRGRGGGGDNLPNESEF